MVPAVGCMQPTCVAVSDTIRSTDRVPESNAHDTLTWLGQRTGTGTRTATTSGVAQCDRWVAASCAVEFTCVAV